MQLDGLAVRIVHNEDGSYKGGISCAATDREVILKAVQKTAFERLGLVIDSRVTRPDCLLIWCDLVDGHGNIAPQELLQACAGTELEMETTPNQTPICEFEVSRIIMPLETSPFEAAINHRWMQHTPASEPETIPRRLVLTNVHHQRCFLFLR